MYKKLGTTLLIVTVAWGFAITGYAMDEGMINDYNQYDSITEGEIVDMEVEETEYQSHVTFVYEYQYEDKTYESDITYYKTNVHSEEQADDYFESFIGEEVMLDIDSDNPDNSSINNTFGLEFVAYMFSVGMFLLGLLYANRIKYGLTNR